MNIKKKTKSGVEEIKKKQVKVKKRKVDPDLIGVEFPLDDDTLMGIDLSCHESFLYQGI